ncbi:MAG: hypothetical protein WCF77_03890 [Minisyncoccia bacterium]
MNISVVFAQILGIFFVVVGASMVVNKKLTTAAVEEAIRDQGSLWMWGFLAVITGAVIIPLNNMWTSGLPLVITILGWLALIKGVLILFFPAAMVSLYRKFIKESMMIPAGLVVFVLGLVLLYVASL